MKNCEINMKNKKNYEIIIENKKFMKSLLRLPEDSATYFFFLQSRHGIS